MAPIYQYECEDCDAITEDIRQISQRHLSQTCSSCGARANFRFSVVTCKTYPGYTDPVMGEVRGYKQERSLLKKHGKVLVAETPQWAKFKEQRKKAVRKPIYSTSAGTTRMKRGSE